MLIIFKIKLFFAHLHTHRNYLLFKFSLRKSFSIFLLALQRKFVLSITADVPLLRHILCCFTHRVWIIHFAHFFIYKTPAHCGIKNLCITVKGRCAFRHYKRCPAHAFHAAGNHQFCIAAGNRTGAVHDSLQATGAKPVYGIAGHTNGKACQQRRHPGYITVIFPALVCSARNHIFNCIHINTRVADEERFNNISQQIIGAHIS